IAFSKTWSAPSDLSGVTAKVIRGLCRCDRSGAARGEFFACDLLLFNQQRHHRVEPSLVVTRIEVYRRGDALDRMTELVGAAEAATHHARRDREHPLFPIGMKDRFVLFDL